MQFDIENAGRIADQLGLSPTGVRLEPVAGGDIARAWLLSASGQRIFLKTLAADEAPLLSAEADGLQALACCDGFRTPRMIGRGIEQGFAWLALEYLDLRGRNRVCDARLGRALAALHCHRGHEFGWFRDNFIGRTRQPNRQGKDWSAFFVEQRLGFQLDQLQTRDPGGRWARLHDLLATRWRERFGQHQPAPSLIHGDLWSGNASMDHTGEPVLFDPAVHFADRECDLAMTRLFGGFSDDFYRAYQETWPLPPDHAERIEWYQLYHLLNHANLFGGGYLDRCRRAIGGLVG